MAPWAPWAPWLWIWLWHCGTMGYDRAAFWWQLKNPNTQKSCNIGKSTKNPAGNFASFNATVYTAHLKCMSKDQILPF